MQTFKVVFRIETESETNTTVISEFDCLKSVKTAFKQQVKNSYRGMISDDNFFKEFLSESVALELWVSGDFEQDICQQTIYKESVIDRQNYKGDHPINYYGKGTYNGKQLMYEMYFQGAREYWGRKRKVKESELKNWYYR